MPFWLATFLFVTAFVILFEWPLATDRADRARRLAFAPLLAAVIAAGVTAALSARLPGAAAVIRRRRKAPHVADNLAMLGQALLGFMTVDALFHVAWATLLGIAVGALPGLTATLGVALMTTLTFKMAANDAILILICMYIGAIYGGSRSAILLNIPGTPANAATTLDGFPLARQGEAGRAMGIATTGSFLGSMIGILFLATIAPVLAEFALDFGAFEFFWLAVFGIVICGHLTALDDPIKGWISGFLGLLVAMVGQEGIHAYPRFAYGSTDLAGGIGLLPALVGAFGFSEVLIVMKERAAETVRSATDRVMPKLEDLTRYWRTDHPLGHHRHHHGHPAGRRRGHGRLGVLCRGAPREQGARKIRQGLGRGPDGGRDRQQRRRAGRDHPGPDARRAGLGAGGGAARRDVHPRRAAGPADHDRVPDLHLRGRRHVLLATFGILIFGLLLTRPLLYVLAVPRERLMPVIFVLCTIGSFAIASRVFDIWVMLGLRHPRPRAARDEVSDGASGARPGARRRSWTRACAAAWC